MTAAVVVTPSKAKAYVALAGTLVTFIVPYVLQYADLLPPPWPDIIRGCLGLLTVLGVYQTPNKPSVVAEVVPVNPGQPEQPPVKPESYDANPWD